MGRVSLGFFVLFCLFLKSYMQVSKTDAHTVLCPQCAEPVTATLPGCASLICKCHNHIT